MSLDVMAAQIYMLDKNVKDVGVQFSASGVLTNTSFSIWTIKGTSATCVAQSQTSALPSGVQNYIASDVNLPAGERLIFIWNANNAGQTLNITDFGASYTDIDDHHQNHHHDHRQGRQPADRRRR